MKTDNRGNEFHDRNSRKRNVQLYKEVMTIFYLKIGPLNVN